MPDQTSNRNPIDWRLVVGIAALVIALLGFLYGTNQCGPVPHPSWLVPVLKVVCPASTPGPTITPTPSPPTAIATPPASMLLDEQFDNHQYDSSLNRSVWLVQGELDPVIASHTQSNGVLTCAMQTLESQDSELHSIMRWPINEIDYAEWRVKIDESVRGDWASLALGLVAETDERFACNLKFHERDQGLSCVMWKPGQNAIDITSGNTPIQPNTWYTLRVSVTENPLEFSVYLGGILVVSYVVENPAPWTSGQVHIYSSLAGDNIESAIIARMDYAVVAAK